jgi:outer membrane protein
VGNKSKGDLLVMQASEANDKYNSVIAKNNLNISYLTLSQLLEFKSSEGFTVFNPDSLSIDIVKKPTTVDDVYNEAVGKMPEIKSAEFDLLNNEKGLAIAKGQLSPQISFSGNYSSGYSNEVKQIKPNSTTHPDTIGAVDVNGIPTPVVTQIQNYSTSNYSFIDQIKNNAYKSLSFNINVPIFNRLQTRTNISNAKLKLADSQYNLEIAKKDLYKQIQRAYLDAVAALEKYNSASESVNSNSEAFKYSQQKYDVGIMSAVDYNTAKTLLITAKSNLIQAKYQYIFKMKILDFYRGLPIVL